MRTRTCFLAASLALLAAGPTRAQDESPRASGKEDRSPISPEEMARKMSRMREEARKMQERQLEALRKLDPEAARRQEQDATRNRQMQDIVTRLRRGQTTEEEAKRALFPLMKEEMQPELKGLKNRIERLEKKLAALKKAEKDPDSLVARRVDAMVAHGGRGAFSPGDWAEGN